MTDWSRFWMKEVRASFPQGDIQLCTGGHAPSEHGADFAEQCKVAAEVSGGVRITNEGSDIAGNFSLTRWVASAGRQYGSHFSFEPAGAVDANGVIARIYNAATSGARGLHYYFPNLFDTEAARENFVRWGAEFRQRQPITEIAVYYPQTYIKLNTNDFLAYVQPLRDRFDFVYRSDGQIRDGGLKGVRALVLLNGRISEAATWQAVSAWVDRGGLLLYPDGMGRLRTVEGDETIHDKLLAPAVAGRRGRALTFHGGGKSAEYRAFVARTLRDATELGADTRAMLTADGEEDGVFVSLCAPRELVWLNYTAKPVTKGGRALPAYSIVAQDLSK
jgi:hypothetical protein